MRKIIKTVGISLFFVAMGIWFATLFMNDYILTQEIFEAEVTTEHQQILAPEMGGIIGKEYSNVQSFSMAIKGAQDEVNAEFDKVQAWDKKIYGYEMSLTRKTANGVLADNKFLFFLLTYIMATLGALAYIMPDIKLLPGIKNNKIYFKPSTSRGWLGIGIGIFLVSFYIFLYFYPHLISNWIVMVDPVSKLLNGGEASQWFMYGFLYTICITVMGIRMLIKYRGNKYQTFRTISVMFFQLAIAFILPEILVRLNQPYVDLKNMWPLDYSFFFDYRINAKLEAGTFGIFLLVWGIVLFAIGVPVLVYFFGKRWYCSWVCGCGGLAETLGDPFRQLSDKSLKAWQAERYIIHGVLVFAVLMTIGVLYTYFTGSYNLLGFIPTESLKSWYGFGIGSIFAGVVGTGFYPLMGNRVWCRFGCPLAAYLGFVQRFKSRFRITTNGGQCISCGNCSTFCEMGIDVRAYAQKGQDIVRSSCVGCGICAAVCPRGVLNLENASVDTRALEERGWVK
jgi:polyferredoxin